MWRYWDGAAWTDLRSAVESAEPLPVDALQPAAAKAPTWMRKRGLWLVAATVVLSLSIALAVVVSNRTNESGSAPEAGEQALADGFATFLKNTEANFTYEGPLTPEQTDGYFLNKLLPTYHYDAASEPTPARSILYMKAACILASQGGNPSSQLADEFAAQPFPLQQALLGMANFYCPSEHLDTRFPNGADNFGAGQ